MDDTTILFILIATAVAVLDIALAAYALRNNRNRKAAEKAPEEAEFHGRMDDVADEEAESADTDEDSVEADRNITGSYYYYDDDRDSEEEEADDETEPVTPGASAEKKKAESVESHGDKPEDTQPEEEKPEYKILLSREKAEEFRCPYCGAANPYGRKTCRVCGNSR